MDALNTEEYDNINPEEIIQRLKRLLDYYEKRERIEVTNEKELSNSSISRD